MTDDDLAPEDDLDPPVDPADNVDADPPADLEDEPGDPANEPEDEPVTAAQEPSPADRQPQRQESRGERRFGSLAARLEQTERTNRELNQRIDLLLAGGTRQPAGESPEARVQRLSMMTPEERMQETLREATVAHRQDMQTLNLRVMDSTDRAAYEAKSTVDPLYAKWKPKVEAKLAELRSQGQNIEREKILYYMIGENAVAKRGEVKNTQRRQGQQRVAAQRTRPGNSGSDVQPNRARSSSLEKRLENVEL